MSVSLSISRPDGETEFVFLCGQRTAEQWIGEMARKHGFRILTGGYPAFMHQPGDLDQAIFEVGVLRDEMVRRIESNESFDDEVKALNRRPWDQVLARLQKLKDEPYCEAHFG